MKELGDKFAELFKQIKEPKYFFIGIGILVVIFLLLPFLKLLAIVLAIVFIFISILPEHKISKQINDLINQYKFW
jgi:hypothetical protein